MCISFWPMAPGRRIPTRRSPKIQAHAAKPSQGDNNGRMHKHGRSIMFRESRRKGGAQSGTQKPHRPLATHLRAAMPRARNHQQTLERGASRPTTDTRRAPDHLGALNYGFGNYDLCVEQIPSQVGDNLMKKRHKRQ